MADVNDAGLENLELAKINTTANAPYTAEANLSPERLAQQKKIDFIIASVGGIGKDFTPQNKQQKKIAEEINGFNNNQPEIDALRKHYEIKSLSGGVSYDDYYETKEALSSLSENPNGEMLGQLLQEVGGFDALVKSNSEFDESLDYDKKLEVYGIYLKEKYGAGVFHNAEFVDKSSLDELVDLKKNPNPERLDSIVQEMGGVDTLITMAANYRQEVNGYYDQRKSMHSIDEKMTVGDIVDMNQLDSSVSKSILHKEDKEDLSVDISERFGFKQAFDAYKDTIKIKYVLGEIDSDSFHSSINLTNEAIVENMSSGEQIYGTLKQKDIAEKRFLSSATPDMIKTFNMGVTTETVDSLNRTSGVDDVTYRNSGYIMSGDTLMNGFERPKTGLDVLVVDKLITDNKVKPQENINELDYGKKVVNTSGAIPEIVYDLKVVSDEVKHTVNPESPKRNTSSKLKP